MWDLQTLARVNDREVARQEGKRTWPKYGYTGSVSDGIHLRRDQNLLTFFIRPGQPALRFFTQLTFCDTEQEREAVIHSYFPNTPE